MAAAFAIGVPTGFGSLGGVAPADGSASATLVGAGSLAGVAESRGDARGTGYAYRLLVDVTTVPVPTVAPSSGAYPTVTAWTYPWVKVS